MEPEPKLKSYAEQELSKIARYLHKPIEAHLVFDREKKRCQAEVQLIGDGDKFFAREQADDFYLAFDQALSKLLVQVKKHHDRWKRAKNKADIEEEDLGEATGEFEIVRSSEHLVSKPITLEEAADYLMSSQKQFIMFRNADNEKISVLYRRGDGNLGLIEPEQ
jgi:putative sigma-54 modulation protein